MGKHLLMIALILFSFLSVAQTSKTENPLREPSWDKIQNAIKSVQNDFNKLKRDQNALRIARRSKDRVSVQAAKKILKLDRISLRKNIHYTKVLGVKNPVKIVNKQNNLVAKKIIYRRHNKMGLNEVRHH